MERIFPSFIHFGFVLISIDRQRSWVVLIVVGWSRSRNSEVGILFSDSSR
jgi:hypothetical protein